MTRAFLGVALATSTSRAEVTTAPAADDLDVRLTLSTLFYRELGDVTAPLVTNGAAFETASPVRRFFGDLRLELTDGGLVVDARVRQTASRQFQSGADGGSEYELRALAYRFGGATRSLTVGRQAIDGAAGLRLDGAMFRQRVATGVAVVAFAGAFPVLGSRSVTTDYPDLVLAEGEAPVRVLPVGGGIGTSITTTTYRGDLAVGGAMVSQAASDASISDRSRVFATASGYLRAGSAAELYHYALVDVVDRSAGLTNGSVGATVHPSASIQLAVSVHHASAETLAIAARALLEDPDPTAVGILQNDTTLIRISQDAARAAASLALAARRFEITVTGGIRRRPEVSVPLSDGTGELAFAEARNVDASIGVLDRRSIFGLRLSASGTITAPLGDVPTSARGTTVQLIASRAFSRERGSVDVDVMAGRYRSTGATADCMTTAAPLTCYGAAETRLAQLGALVALRVSREWLLIADLHLGYRDTETRSLELTRFPAIFSTTAFARAQWRFR